MTIHQRRVQKQQKNQTKKPKPTFSDTNKSFSDHIKELRWRLLWVGLVFAIASAIAFQYHDTLVWLVMRPLEGQKLVYLTPGGGFSFIFQVTLYAALVVTAPMLMYQLYGFVRPALPESAQRSAVKVVVAAVALMLVGVGYGYFVAIPSALAFLSTFAGSSIVPNLTADSYLGFFLAYIAGLGLLFQLPLLLLFWHWINPMSPGGLLKSERIVILFAFIAAALITPTPDVINQAMIAVPLIAIYQFGAVTVLTMIIRERRAQKTTKPAAAYVAKHIPDLQPVAFIPKTSVEHPGYSMRVKPQPASLSKALAASPAKKNGVYNPKGSLDGLSGVAARKATPQQSAPVPHARTVAPRPLPTLQRRPFLSIDGVSSI